MERFQIKDEAHPYFPMTVVAQRVGAPLSITDLTDWLREIKVDRSTITGPRGHHYDSAALESLTRQAQEGDWLVVQRGNVLALYRNDWFQKHFEPVVEAA